MKRSPLPRGDKPLQRRTPLPPAQPLARGGGPARTTPLPRPRTPVDGPAPGARVPMPRKRPAYTGPTKAVLDVVRARDGCCVIGIACAGRAVDLADLVGHHRRNRGMGGSTAPDTNEPPNVILVCRMDNGLLEDGENGPGDLARYRANGWKVRQGTDPSTVPVRYPDGRMYVLDRLGARTPSD